MTLGVMADGTPQSSPPAPTDAGVDERVARGGLRWKRVSLGFVSAVAVGFIALSVAQIVPAVFGARIRPLPSATPGSPARICAEGVRRLAGALDRAGALAGGPAFDEALAPAWSDAPAVEQACARSPEGLDAWASLLRLRSAEQQLARKGVRGPDAVGDLQREVASHLPGDLR
jgi:hypothetical protein